ncbi:MAG: hypothetical protein IJH94_05105, partial [Clostridia bacterium]|nr:hypothetical protein [Clostridia bacterium]
SSHNNMVTVDQLKDEVVSGLNIGITNMAKATKLAASDLSTWYYVDGVLSFSRESAHKENTMTVDPETLTVTLSGDEITGNVYAAMYDETGKLLEVKQYPASETVEVGFDDNAQASYVKVMWWRGEMYPMCEAKTISLQQ